MVNMCVCIYCKVATKEFHQTCNRYEHSLTRVDMISISYVYRKKVLMGLTCDLPLASQMH